MKTASIIALAGAAAVAAAGTTNTYGPGAGFAIPDNDPLGITSSIMVADTGTIQDLDVNLNGMSHTWIGDLVITLTHEDSGTSVDIANRAGQLEGGSATFGFNIDVDGDYTFDDESANGSWHDQLANNGGALPAGDYNSFASLDAFDGLDVSGTWTIFMSDNAGGDTGSLGGWSITATIPAPGAVALAGMGGLVATRRRRA